MTKFPPPTTPLRTPPTRTDLANLAAQILRSHSASFTSLDLHVPRQARHRGIRGKFSVLAEDRGTRSGVLGDGSTARAIPTSPLLRAFAIRTRHPILRNLHIVPHFHRKQVEVFRRFCNFGGSDVNRESHLWEQYSPSAATEADVHGLGFTRRRPLIASIVGRQKHDHETETHGRWCDCRMTYGYLRHLNMDTRRGDMNENQKMEQANACACLPSVPLTSPLLKSLVDTGPTRKKSGHLAAGEGRWGWNCAIFFFLQSTYSFRRQRSSKSTPWLSQPVVPACGQRYSSVSCNARDGALDRILHGMAVGFAKLAFDELMTEDFLGAGSSCDWRWVGRQWCWW